MRTLHIAFLALASSALLAACTASDESTAATFQTEIAARAGTVNASEAAALITAYRKSKGLGLVTVDATLMAIARVHSDRMARSNTMSHVLPGEGSFRTRLEAGNYDAGMAAENVAAGQSSLSEVLAAWRASPSHNENLLERNVSEIGIAVSVAPNSTYKYYWTLVLGRRREAGPVGGPTGSGGYISAGGLVVPIQ